MIVDLRSDTVTRPSEGMRRAMAAAEVGDDVFGDDPTVNRLQERAAEIFGFEASLFFPTGTQSNLAALMSHCQRGDEVLVGMEAHTYRYEAGGGAVLGSIQPQAIVNRPDGTLDLKDVEAAIKPDDPHFAKDAAPRPGEHDHRARDPARLLRRGARAREAQGPRHAPGRRAHLQRRGEARAFPCGNCAAASTRCPRASPRASVRPRARCSWARRTSSRRRSARARSSAASCARRACSPRRDSTRWSTTSSGWRKTMPTPTRLAEGIGAPAPSSNMVFFDSRPGLPEHLAKHGVIVLPGPRLRLVTHLDVDRAGIDRAIAAFNSFK
jgi:threonine aldolase